LRLAAIGEAAGLAFFELGHGAEDLTLKDGFVAQDSLLVSSWLSVGNCRLLAEI
jgi:hypothetical protein